MKSGKPQKSEIKANRLDLIARRERALADLPVGAVAADLTRLAPYSSFDSPPQFYVDYAFSCCDCNSAEVWRAKQQKWWFEVAKGPLGSRAVRCRACRRIERARADEARRVSQEGLARKIEMQKAQKPEKA